MARDRNTLTINKPIIQMPWGQVTATRFLVRDGVAYTQDKRGKRIWEAHPVTFKRLGTASAVVTLEDGTEIHVKSDCGCHPAHK